MKVSEQFKSTIKAYLDNMAAVDSLFAPVYQKDFDTKIKGKSRNRLILDFRIKIFLIDRFDGRFLLDGVLALLLRCV